MANAIKWQSWTDRGTVLTTELNSLTTGSRTNAGSQIDNATNKDQWGKLEVSVTFAVAPSAASYLELHALTAPDGTNYEDGSSSADPGAHTLVAYIPLKAVTTAQRLMSPIFRLEPAKTKFILKNQSGQSFPASASTVKLYTTNDEIQ